MKMSTEAALRCLFAVIGAFLFADCTIAGDVITLTDSDFKTKLAENELTLVKFYAPWCGHCKALAPEFEKAAEELRDHIPPVALAEIDCVGLGKKTCEDNGATAYPTLAVFTKHADKVFDYDGPRDTESIVRFMKKRAGPTCKELKNLEETEQFLDNFQHSIIGFFEKEDRVINDRFHMLAIELSDFYRFAHTNNASVLDKFGYKDNVVLFQPKRLHNRVEPSALVYDGVYSPLKLKQWVNENIHGLVGHRTLTNLDQFHKPLVVVYYNVDYIRDTKGSNYWRNRVLAVAKTLSDDKTFNKLTIAVSNWDDFQHEVVDYFGLQVVGNKPVVGAWNKDEIKFAMSDDFTPENFEKFVRDFVGDSLIPYMKSQPIPESNDGPVKVVVGKTFDEIVRNSGKDVLIDFFAPWSGHCKAFAPVYEKIAHALKDEPDIVVARMDGTANDVPMPFNVVGYPSIYLSLKDSSVMPKLYRGEKSVQDIIKFVASESTNQLHGYTRDGVKIERNVKTEL